MTQTTDELCFDLLRVLRDGGLHPSEGALAVVQTLAALRLVRDRPTTAVAGPLPALMDQARHVWRASKPQPGAVSPFDREFDFERLSPRDDAFLLSRASAVISDADATGSGAVLDLCIALARGADTHRAFVSLSAQLTDALIALLNPVQGETAYCAFAGAAETAFRLGEHGLTVRLDLERGVASFWSAVAAASGYDVAVREAPPIEAVREWSESPGLGSSLPFDLALVIPPFGVKLNSLYRLGTTAENIGVELAARAGKRGAAVVPGSVLFRTTAADQAFKAGLIERLGLTAVVALPHGLLQPHTNIASGALLFNRGAHSGRVLMVDPTAEGAGTAHMAEHIATVLQGPGDTPWSRMADLREIAEQGFNLSPERYVLPASTRRLHALLDRGPTARLGDLVEILRPQLVVGVRDQDPGPGLREVSVGDIGDFGLVERPERRVEPEADQIGRISKALVYPDDILLVAKGSVGKVAFIATPTEDWIASQSFVILRPRRHSPLADAAYLYRYLASEIGQTLIETFKAGTSVPILQMADIKSFPVLLPSADEQVRIGCRVRELFELQRQIEELRLEGARREAGMWPADHL